MYQILIDGVLLYDAVDDSQSVSEASITQEINAAAYLDLTVSGTSPVAISEGSSVAEVLWEGKTLFHGLVTDVTEDTYGQLKVSAVSDIDRLNDVLVRPNSTDGSVGEQSPSTLGAYFNWLVTQYNAGNVGGFRIDVGVNQGDQLRTAPLSIETTDYPSVASCIDSNVLSNGGYLYYTPFSGGGTLDLYADLHEASDQLIEVGENVVSIEVTRTDDSVVTALVPYATVDGEELTISGASGAELQMLSNAGFSVNGDALYSYEQVAKYGYRESRVEFDGATSVTELIQLAVPYLRTVMSPSVTVSVKAVDMALYKEGYDHLKVGQAVHVRSALHGIDEYMAVQDMDLDLEDPSQTSYTLGVSYDTLTGQQSAFLSKLNGSINGALDKVTGLEDTIGKVVNDSNVEYYVSTSPDEPTGGEWGVAVVTPTDNRYVFSHTKNELVDGTIVTSDPTLVTPSITRSLQLHRDFGTEGYTWVNFIAANYDVTDEAAGVCRIVGQMGGWDADRQGAVTVAFGFQDSAYSTGSGSMAGVGVVSEKSSDIDLDATDVLSFVDNGRVSVWVRCKGQVTVNLYAEGDGFSTPFVEQTTQPGGTQVFDLADVQTTYDSAILQADNAIRAYVSATYATQDALGQVESSFDLRANQIEASVEEKMDTSVANSTFVDKSTYNQFSDSITQTVSSVQTTAEGAAASAQTAQDKADAAQTAADSAASAATSAQSTATQALTKATKVEQTAEGLTTTVSQVQQTAEDAQQTAESMSILVDTGEASVAHAGENAGMVPYEVDVYGATKQNLWVNPSGTSHGVTVTSNDDGSVGLSGQCLYDNILIEAPHSYAFKPGETYAFSVDKLSDVILGWFFYSSDGNGIYIGGIAQGSLLSRTYTLPQDTEYVRMGVHVNKTDEPLSGTYRVMLREATEDEIAAAQQTASTLQEGGTADLPQDHPVTLPADASVYATSSDFDWCPPGINGVNPTAIVISQTDSAEDGTSTPIDMQGNVLYSLPDGTRDELRIDGSGKVAKAGNIEKIVLNGAENWYRATTPYTYYTISLSSDKYSTMNLTDIYVSGLPAGNIAGGLYISNYGKSLYIREPSFCTDVSSLKSWLSSNPVTVVYPLATPAETDLGTVAMPSLPSGDANVWAVSDIPATVRMLYYGTNAKALDSYATKAELKITSESITSTVTEVSQTADEALTKASTFEQTVDGVQVTLTTTTQTANDAKTAAQAAQSSADAASSAASAAQSTADSASTAASKAQQTANSASTAASNAQSAADAAQSAADTAQQTATDAAKTATNYLRFDSSGLCIGNQTSGTLGYNALITSSQYQIRNGSTVLSSFGASEVNLGQNSTGSIIRMCGGRGYISSQGSGQIQIVGGSSTTWAAISNSIDLYSNSWGNNLSSEISLGGGTTNVLGDTGVKIGNLKSTTLYGVYCGTTIVNPNGQGWFDLFSPSQQTSMFGRPFNVDKGDVFLAMNGDTNAQNIGISSTWYSGAQVIGVSFTSSVWGSYRIQWLCVLGS